MSFSFNLITKNITNLKKNIDISKLWPHIKKILIWGLVFVGCQKREAMLKVRTAASQARMVL